MSALNYAASGVNRETADQLVEKIAALSKKTLQGTLRGKVKSSIGGYASLYALTPKRWLAASTDGVGTKLKLAFKLNKHNTIGIDLVAMSVNDLLCVGATPLFFLDYFATGTLDTGVAEEVLAGIVEGCSQAGCALVGGETAEMPDFYDTGEYDLGGFAVGDLAPTHALPKKDIRPGDALIGIRSSGCHSNGFSLLRKLLPTGSAGDALAKELLEPTRIYAKALLPLIALRKFKGLAHITGSGFLNVPRMSEKVSYEINLPEHAQLPSIYDWIRRESMLSLSELAQTFNLGIGMVGVVAGKDVAFVLKHLKKSKEQAWVIGKVCPKRAKHPAEVILSDGAESTILQ